VVAYLSFLLVVGGLQRLRRRGNDVYDQWFGVDIWFGCRAFWGGVHAALMELTIPYSKSS
jgi:hypothetical protein